MAQADHSHSRAAPRSDILRATPACPVGCAACTIRCAVATAVRDELVLRLAHAEQAVRALAPVHARASLH